MFKDRIKLRFQAGKGGDGHVSFDKQKRPDGGIGGDGGSIYLEGTTNHFDYRNFTGNKLYKADNGVDGGRNNLEGHNGADIILKVPLATCVYNDKGERILIIEEDKERKLLVQGGRGGVGNYYFKKGGVKTLDFFKPGKPGQKVDTHLELELISDVIFLGLPNAGKSSVLDQLSEARPKIADYEFTTLTPQMGMGGGVIMMDLPGLIEGTFEGKGLGTDFIKHTRRTKFVAHFVSLVSDDPVKDYYVIRNEIKKIDKKLDKKEEIIVLTKTDEVDKEKVDEVTNDFIKIAKKKKKDIVAISVLDDEATVNLLEIFKERCK